MTLVSPSVYVYSSRTIIIKVEEKLYAMSAIICKINTVWSYECIGTIHYRRNTSKTVNASSLFWTEIRSKLSAAYYRIYMILI